MCASIINKNVVGNCTYLYNAGSFNAYNGIVAEYFSSGTLFFDDVIERLKSAKDFIIDTYYDRKYGARPLRRAIQKEIIDALSIDLLNKKINDNDIIKVFCEDKKIVLKKMESLEEHENKEES